MNYKFFLIILILCLLFVVNYFYKNKESFVTQEDPQECSNCDGADELCANAENIIIPNTPNKPNPIAVPKPAKPNSIALPKIR